jgi:hypothetical protein
MDKSESCIICRDSFVTVVSDGQAQPPADTEGTSAETSRKIYSSECRRIPSCGHIFHVQCLKSWLLMQQTCPTCRKEVKVTETPSPPPATNGGPMGQQNLPPSSPGVTHHANVTHARTVTTSANIGSSPLPAVTYLGEGVTVVRIAKTAGVSVSGNESKEDLYSREELERRIQSLDQMVRMNCSGFLF